MSPDASKVEYFVQLDRTFGAAATWGGAIGANIEVGRFEIILETGFRPNYYASVGTIFTLN